MLTWSKPNAIIPDKPLRWILTTLRFYAIVAMVGVVLAFAVISILAAWSAGLRRIDIARPIEIGQMDRIEGGVGTMVILIAMIILFGAATYFTGRFYGKAGYITWGVGFAVVCITLAFLGALGVF